MPRSERLTHRVTPQLLDALDAARGLIPRSRWVESAIEAKLAAGGVPVAPPPAAPGLIPPEPAPDPADPASYPRREPPRMTGGRRTGSEGEQ